MQNHFLFDSFCASIRNMLHRRTNSNAASTENGRGEACDSSMNDNCADVDSNSAGNSSNDNNDHSNMSAQSQSDLASNTSSEENKLSVSKSTVEVPGLK